MIELPATIERLRDDGALFVINHSAGKDSQAMTLALRGLIPAQQMVVVHADLGEVEWPGNLDHISRTIGDLPLQICRNENKSKRSVNPPLSRFPVSRVYGLAVGW
jgi:hypothetical protein